MKGARMQFSITLTEPELIELIECVDRIQAWSGYSDLRFQIWMKAMDHIKRCVAVPTYLVSMSEELPYLEAAENFSPEELQE